MKNNTGFAQYRYMADAQVIIQTVIYREKMGGENGFMRWMIGHETSRNAQH